MERDADRIVARGGLADPLIPTRAIGASVSGRWGGFTYPGSGGGA